MMSDPGRFNRFRDMKSSMGWEAFAQDLPDWKGRACLSQLMVKSLVEAASRIRLMDYPNADWFYEKLLGKSFWTPVPSGQPKPRCMELYTLNLDTLGEWIVVFGDAYLAKAHLNRGEYEPQELPCVKLAEWCVMQGKGLLVVESSQRILEVSQFELRFLSEGEVPPGMQVTNVSIEDLEWLEPDVMALDEVDGEALLPVTPIDLTVFGTMVQDIQRASLLSQSILDALYLFARPNMRGDALEQELIPFQLCLGICLRGPFQQEFLRQYKENLQGLLEEQGLENLDLIFMEEHPALMHQVKMQVPPLVSFQG